MKENSLEKFTRSHREHFDYRSPSEKVWKRISNTLFGRDTVSLWNSVSIWRAAAVILLTLSTYLFFTNQRAEVNSKQLTSLQDFKDVESYYAAQISEKATLISNEGLFIDNSFTQDLQKLEAMYTVLAEEMKKHPSETVKDALVLTMLVRIDLLNQQIQKLEESKKGPGSPSSI